MSFKKNKYKIIRNALPNTMGNFLYFYFLLKRSVCKELQTKNDPMSKSYRHLLGQFGDEQIKTNCFVTYGDTAFDTLLELIKPVLEHHTKHKLIPTYSYARIYEIDLKQGDMLIYRGSDLEHWRNPFEGSICLQVFLHYNEDKQKNKRYLYDGRKHLGIPK